VCEPARVAQLRSSEPCRKPSECCERDILLLQRTVNYGPSHVPVVGQVVLGLFFLTQDLTPIMVVWHLWPLVFLWHSPLPSDFCRSSWVVTLSAESCHQSLAFVVWAQSRTQNRPRHTHSAVLRSGGGEEISAFVALMMPLILSGFPGLRAQSRRRRSRVNSFGVWRQCWRLCVRYH